MKYGNEIRITTVKKNDNMPYWDELFAFYFTGNINDTVEISIYDTDGLLNDTLIQQNTIAVCPGQQIMKYNFNGLIVYAGDVMTQTNVKLCELYDSVRILTNKIDEKNNELITLDKTHLDTIKNYKHKVRELTERINVLENNCVTMKKQIYETIGLLKNIINK